MASFLDFIDILSPNLTSYTNLKMILDLVRSTDFTLYNLSNYFLLYRQDTDFQRIILFRNNIFEIYLIIWKKGYSTNYHFHPKNGCILKVLKGQLVETIKSNSTEKEKEFIRNKNDTSYIDNTMGIHKVKALDESISLHIYSPPNFFE